MGVVSRIAGLPEGDWAGLAERAVSAFETYVKQGESNVDEADFLVPQLELISSIHGEYHDMLETILQDDDLNSKFRKLRKLSSEAKKRSQAAVNRLLSEYGSQGKAG